MLDNEHSEQLPDVPSLSALPLKQCNFCCLDIFQLTPYNIQYMYSCRHVSLNSLQKKQISGLPEAVRYTKPPTKLLY